MKLVIYPAIPDDALVTVQSVSPDLTIVQADTEEDTADVIADADCFYGTINPRLLSAATKLQWIQTPVAGLENYMFHELMEHPVTLTNMRGIYSDFIADYVLGFVLSFARGFHRYRWHQQERFWSEPLDAIHLSESTLGVIGLGSIGHEIAVRSKAFGMHVIAIDARRTETTEFVDDLRSTTELDWLLAESDFVVIAAPQTPQTEKMMQSPQFKTMKPTAFLINIGRGAIVDLTDLVDALTTKEIAGAGLDVFEQEPLPPEHPLWDMENVIITPHVAGLLLHIYEPRRLQVLVDNLRRFVNGNALVNVVDKTQWF